MKNKGLFLLKYKSEAMETLIIHLESTKKAAALKSVMKALDIKFEIKKKQASAPAKELKTSSYDPEFVAKIKEGEKDYRAGKFKAIKTADLWK